ncbi:MAG: hypothetical protein F4X11_03995 [Acidobacteria bacterium]|nr:hypothetical protein [Acidobacteriota bacterium]
MSRDKAQPEACQTNLLVSFFLAADDISALPERLRERIANTDAGMPGDWALVGTADWELAELFRRVLARLPSMAAIHRQELTERNIELMIRSILPDAPRAEVRAELETDNARLRADYLQETRVLTGPEIRAASGLSPKNASEPASRWKRERRVFAVRHGGRDLYPAFQFEDGQPRPIVKRILREVPATATGWQIALWFASGNGWLDGAEPQDRLDAPGEVVEAARRLAERAEG